MASARPNEPQLFETNLGIESRLRVAVPANKRELQFGRPEHNLAERATLHLSSILASRCRAFLDVGANEGLFTFYVACRPQCRGVAIHSFEPDPDLFSRLSANVIRNGIQAIVNEVAISDHVGRQIFNRDASSDLSGSLSNYFNAVHETRPIEVAVTTLESYFAARAIKDACVKVDVEGAGELVWLGARRDVARINYLIMEIIEPEVRAKLPARIIADTGWHAYYIRDYDLVRSSDGEFKYQAPFYNWLFCRQEPAILARELTGSRFRVLPNEAARS